MDIEDFVDVFRMHVINRDDIVDEVHSGAITECHGPVVYWAVDGAPDAWVVVSSVHSCSVFTTLT